MRKTIIAVAMGGALEMYDFVCYTLLASIIAPLFFPEENHNLALLLAYAVFAIGYLMRPLGGIIYGHFGDKLGRKDTLIVSILMMAFPSFILGVLPTYNSIGLTAPILLIILRVLQGLAVGGDFPGAIVFISEHGDPKKIHLNNSWIFSGVNFGVMLAMGLCSLLAWVFSSEQMSSFAWRIPFLSGLFIAFLGIYYRQKLNETPAFLNLVSQKKRLKAPLKNLLKTYWRNILRGVAIIALSATVVSLIFLFMPSYLHVYLKINMHQAFLFSAINLGVLVALIPVAGLIADKIGLRNALLFCALFFIGLSFPLYYSLVHLNSWLRLLPMFALSAGAAMTIATMGPVAFSLFPPEVRYSGVGVTYNLALAIFGGSAPFFATLILNSVRNPVTICFCLIFSAGLCLLGLLVGARCEFGAKAC